MKFIADNWGNIASGENSENQISRVNHTKYKTRFKGKNKSVKDIHEQYEMETPRS